MAEIPRDFQNNVVTLADLPAANTTRWTPNRKYIVVQAVRHNLISREAALERYGMKESEFSSWEQRADSHGQKGLKVDAFKRYPH